MLLCSLIARAFKPITFSSDTITDIKLLPPPPFLSVMVIYFQIGGLELYLLGYVWNLESTRREKNTKENDFLIFGFRGKCKRKSNIIKIPQNFSYFKIS